MIATPAVDLREGRCVQLVGGRPEEERVSLPDPVAEAVRWHGLGYESLHIVDLDAALGSGNNDELVGQLVRATPAEAQVGGGIRDDARADALLGAGAARVIVGTRAVDDRHWLGALATRHPGRVTVALDTRDGRILRKGWQEQTTLDLPEYLPTLAELPLAGILCTDVGREGRMEGIDRDACARLVTAGPHPIWISGGVTTMEELDFLDSAGAAGVVLGMALYTGALDPRGVAERWGGLPTADQESAES